MRLLVLGGTSFVGRAVVTDALAHGLDVMLFGRGRTGRELFPQVPRLLGDRGTGDYAALAGGRWDAVVDVSAYVPRHVEEAGAALEGHDGRYLLVSTISVYDPARAAPQLAEDAPRLPAERGTEAVTPETYGALKVACEDDVRARYGDAATVVRPGIVAGPHDPTDRFTYWVRRAARGGRMALPGRPEQPVQVVDSRDLARLVTGLLVDDRPGTYDAVGPAEPVTLAGLAAACAEAAGTRVELVRVAPGAAAVPLVLGDPAADPLFGRRADRARAAGLTGTPLVQTARDVLSWDRDRAEPPLAVGPTPEQEAALLRAAQR
ncbi:NAD-dependent epimerase/dehydratase family protein [Motilibacter aurantiacus]|uniref:NAD-dependent epimerase/dehydratase family protein n=1 Tax=Motilibacter aurantiacus TaxID=2714955 RepID=UPI00140C3CB0|nr:NAD-dependent epimerase/dehydratase family protein [Motilibacter aurantiacus]NHC46418.1 NAD-dependent epimerase/dehydratase family protein [Motilibacter aurantiacus]